MKISCQNVYQVQPRPFQHPPVLFRLLFRFLKTNQNIPQPILAHADAQIHAAVSARQHAQTRERPAHQNRIEGRHSDIRKLSLC